MSDIEQIPNKPKTPERLKQTFTDNNNTLLKDFVKQILDNCKKDGDKEFIIILKDFITDLIIFFLYTQYDIIEQFKLYDIEKTTISALTNKDNDDTRDNRDKRAFAMVPIEKKHSISISNINLTNFQYQIDITEIQ